MMIKDKILIGTRGSQLALWQSNWVKNLIIKNFPNVSVELVVVKTEGDKILNVPLANVGGKGLFVKEIEEQLLNDRIDLAVHSMKDMPVVLPEGLHIGAIPKREDPRDVLISKRKKILSTMFEGARIGTSSLRRSAQIIKFRPDLKIVPIRGNIETRLRKLKNQNFDAIVLAASGLIRLGLKDCISEYLDLEIMLPAVGQGALCIEVKEDNNMVKPLLEVIDDVKTRCIITAERSFLARLDGGCQLPIAAMGVIDMKNNELVLEGLVAAADGSVVIKKTVKGDIAYPEKIGISLAELLLSLGAGKIL